MSEENISNEHNDEIANKIIKVNRRAKDEIVAKDFILDKTKDKSFKRKPPANWRLIAFISLIVTIIILLTYWFTNTEESSTIITNKNALFLLNNDYEREELDLILQQDYIVIWTKDKKIDINRNQMNETELSDRLSELNNYEEIKIPGNYKRLNDFFDYCRLSDISRIHLFGDLGQQNENQIDINNLDQYVMIDNEFWEFFKMSDKPILKIHDKGKYSNIKERVIKRRDEVLNEK